MAVLSRSAVQGVRQTFSRQTRCCNPEGKENNRRARLLLVQRWVQRLNNAEIEYCVLGGEMVEECQARPPQRTDTACCRMEFDNRLTMSLRKRQSRPDSRPYIRGKTRLGRRKRNLVSSATSPIDFQYHKNKETSTMVMPEMSCSSGERIVA